MSTLATLRTLIKQEARIKTGTNLDDMVNAIIAEVLIDYCNLQRFYELFKENVAITLVTGQQEYSLPSDFQNLSALRYAVGTTPCIFQQLKLQQPIIKQTFAQGLPLYYRMISGPGISLWPYNCIQATDTLLLDYYINPTSIFSSDGDNFPIPRLESAVKKDVIARIQRFSSALPEAQMTVSDGQQSYTSATGG